jgi:hypothetical protein
MLTKKKWVLRELIQLSKIHVDLTTFSTFAKIGTIQAIAPSETVASIYMTGPTIKQVGNFKNNSNSRKDRDGKESTILISLKKKIKKNYSRLSKSTNLLNFVNSANNISKILCK